MESTGYYLGQWRKRKDIVTDEEDQNIRKIEKAKYDGKLPPKAEEIFKNADGLLKQ